MPCGSVAVAMKLMLSVVVTVAGTPWMVAVTLLIASLAVKFSFTVLPGTMRVRSAWAELIEAVAILLVDATTPYSLSSFMLPYQLPPS